MEFTLFYKSYDFKMSLKAMKMFKEATGKDLWSTLISIIDVYTTSRTTGDSVLTTLKRVADIADYEVASQIFYCMAKQCNSTLQLSEIEDAMFHMGWRPVETPDGQNEPYTVTLYALALDVDKYLQEVVVKKKLEANS